MAKTVRNNEKVRQTGAQAYNPDMTNPRLNDHVVTVDRDIGEHTRRRKLNDS